MYICMGGCFKWLNWASLAQSRTVAILMFFNKYSAGIGLLCQRKDTPYLGKKRNAVVYKQIGSLPRLFNENITRGVSPPNEMAPAMPSPPSSDAWVAIRTADYETKKKHGPHNGCVSNCWAPGSCFDIFHEKSMFWKEKCVFLLWMAAEKNICRSGKRQVGTDAYPELSVSKVVSRWEIRSQQRLKDNHLHLGACYWHAK